MRTAIFLSFRLSTCSLLRVPRRFCVSAGAQRVRFLHTLTDVYGLYS